MSDTANTSPPPLRRREMSARLHEHIQKLVDEAPPLSAAQRVRIRAIADAANAARPSEPPTRAPRRVAS